MKMTSLFSGIPGFHPHTAHLEESRKSSTGILTPAVSHQPIRVFRGIRCQQAQAAVPMDAASYARALRVFRGWPASQSSAMSGLDFSRREQAVRVFRGRIAR